MLDRCLAVLASALPLFLLAGCEIEDPLCVETRRIDPIPNAVSLPVELEQNYGSLTMGLPVVRWRGRDGTERRILVDTGCPATLLLSSRTAAAEHFKPQWFASSTLFDDSGTTMALRRADVPELAIGPVRFRAFRAGLLEPRQGVDGYLGWPLLHGVMVTINYAKGVMVFREGRLPPFDNKDVLPLFRRGGHLLVSVQLNGKPMWLALDTGWGGPANLELTADDAAGVAWASAPVPTMSSIGPSGGTITRKMGRLDGELRLGRHVLVRPIAGVFGTYGAAAAIGAESILPAATLREFVVTLDVRSRCVRLERASAEPIRPGPVLDTGFRCDPRRDPAPVTEVLAGSEAERAGLRMGDLVVAINGKPIKLAKDLPLSVDRALDLDVRHGDRSERLTFPLTKVVP